MRSVKIYILIISILVLILSCSEKTTTPDEDVKYDYSKPPEGFPPIPFPSDNPYSYEKAVLGRKLFYEKLLSRDMNLPSCSHCLKQQNSFCDNIPISKAADKEPEYRNTMPLTNVAYRKNIFWDGRGTMVESPAYRSLWLPQILASDTNIIVQRLENHPEYPELFQKAFGDPKPSAFRIGQAIATFVRTLVSGNSRYDKYIRGDKNALSEQEKRGMALFFSSRTSCSECHSGFLFTDGLYHNTGTSTHYFDRGRFYVTGKNEDRGKFLTPSLRNVEVSAPYLHDGYFLTLEQVIENYNQGGRAWFNKDPRVRPLNLTQQEKNDLIAFLKSLTDWEFLRNKWFSNPNK